MFSHPNRENVFLSKCGRIEKRNCQATAAGDELPSVTGESRQRAEPKTIHPRGSDEIGGAGYLKAFETSITYC